MEFSGIGVMRNYAIFQECHLSNQFPSNYLELIRNHISIFRVRYPLVLHRLRNGLLECEISGTKNTPMFDTSSE